MGERDFRWASDPGPVPFAFQTQSLVAGSVSSSLKRGGMDQDNSLEVPYTPEKFVFVMHSEKLYSLLSYRPNVGNPNLRCGVGQPLGVWATGDHPPITQPHVHLDHRPTVIGTHLKNVHPFHVLSWVPFLPHPSLPSCFENTHYFCHHV